MALVQVLWGLALISVIAASLLSTANLSYRLVGNALDIARDEATFEAAVNRAVLALLDPRADRRWRVDGVFHHFNFDGAAIKVSIQDELGRIDLNHADGPLLVSLFQSAGLDASSSSRLVDKILDWRDPTSAKRLNGAKDRDYQTAGLSQRPRNGPFQSVDELQLVMDMTEQVFQLVEPAVTVHSGRQFIDPQFAPREALMALPSMTADAVASVMAARTNERAGVIQPSVSLKGRAFSIRTEITWSNRATVAGSVIRITENALQPYWILSWNSKR